jgi:HSP20 family protein
MANEVETGGQKDLQTRRKQAVEREGTRPGWQFRPDVDIVERANDYLVTADLPGADERHVEVHLEKGVLSIDAALAVEPDASWRPVHTEYRLGGYHREFRLSDAVDAERISASMRDGVLELHLPKRDAHRPRQISVQGS